MNSGTNSLFKEILSKQSRAQRLTGFTSYCSCTRYCLPLRRAPAAAVPGAAPFCTARVLAGSGSETVQGRDCCYQWVCILGYLHCPYIQRMQWFSRIFSLLFILEYPCISCFVICTVPPFPVMAILATSVMHTYGLESGQLLAWQTFYDAVGVSGCSKCNSKTNPCGCSSYYIGCTGDGQYLTKIRLFSCSLSGKLWLCLPESNSIIPLNESLSPHTNLVIFVGNIPTEIGALTELTYLSLRSNSLSGKIRTTLYHNPIQ